MSISSPSASTPATSVSSSSSGKPPPLAGTLRHLTLPSKPSSKLAYIYQHVTQNGWISFSLDNPRLYRPHLLIVFINGLTHTMSSFTLAINRFISSLTLVASSRISILAYDRYSTGLSIDPDPADLESCHPGPVPNIALVVRDLRELIDEVLVIHHGSPTHRQPSSPSRARSSPSPSGRVSPLRNPGSMSTPSPDSQKSPNELPSLLLVGQGIGIPIARLFATTYSATVSGLLLLDNTLTTVFADTISAPLSLTPRDDLESEVMIAANAHQGSFSPGTPVPGARHPPPSPLLSPDGHSPFVQVVVQHSYAPFADEERESERKRGNMQQTRKCADHSRRLQLLMGLTTPERWGGVVEVDAEHSLAALQVHRSDLIGALLKGLVERWLETGWIYRVRGLASM